MDKLLEILRRTEINAACAFILLALCVYPYQNFTANGFLLAASGLICAALALLIAKRLSLPVLNPAVLIALGFVIRVVVGTLTAPVPISDALTYTTLAQQISQGHSYVDPEGRLAFSPPGYPLYLAPFFAVLGNSLAALLVANISLYFIGALSLYKLAQRRFDDQTASVALLLYVLWPSHILLVAVGAKEYLSVAMALAALCCIDRALTIKTAWALPGGLALGLAVLTQPGLALFGLVLPIAFRSELKPFDGTRLKVVLVATLTAVAIVSPWMLRNYFAFDSKFSGIATNGGSVFYRSNNELATGLWTARGKRSFEGLDELSVNRLGFQWGKEWIVQHPADAARLSMRKMVQILSNESHGAYWALVRTETLDDNDSIKALAQNDTGKLAFRSARFISNLFWLIVLACSFWGLRQASKSGMRHPVLIYPLLYIVAVHSVFESGSRHHMIPFALLFVFAALQLTRERDTSDCV